MIKYFQGFTSIFQIRLFAHDHGLGNESEISEKTNNFFYQSIFLFVIIYCTIVEFHRDGASGYCAYNLFSIFWAIYLLN